DSLVLGDVHITAPLRGALPGAVLGRRSIVGVMVALPAWPGASSRLTLGSAPERGHAGGVSGVAAGSQRPSSHALRSADFGEPDCVAGPGWSCAVMALALTQRLPRSARLTTSTSLTTDLSSGGGLADAQVLLDGGKHVIHGATLQPGAALHVGRASGFAAWSGVQGRTAGMHVRASRGTVLRPSVRWSGGAAEAGGSDAPSSESGRPWQGSWDARRATEGNVDAWWSPRSWLRASAGFRSWTERAAGSEIGRAHV